MAPMMLDAMIAAARPPTDPGELASQVLPWLGFLVVVVLVGGVVIWLVRRSMGAASAAVEAGFTLQDLRDLHASGELSDEEFEGARAAMIGRLRRSELAPGPEEDQDASESAKG